jgi:hypothetical protein
MPSLFTMSFRLLLSIAVLGTCSLATNVRAQLGVHWQYKQTVFEVTPTSSVYIQGVLFNDSADHLLTSGAGGSFSGDLQKRYDFHVSFGSEFVGLDLPPGKSLTFSWGLLTPIDGFVPPGTYHSDPAFINLNGNLIYPDNQFEIRVSAVNPPPVSAVPEANASTLIFLTMATVLLFRLLSHSPADRISATPT